MKSNDNNNILSLLNNYTITNAEDIAHDIAENFRRRRIERNMSR